MATNKTAFEAPKDRFAYYCAGVINKYEPVVLNSDGVFEPATPTSLTDATQLAGICQYGSETVGDMVTVVKGAFPTVAAEAIPAGSLVSVSDKTTTVNGFTYHSVVASASGAKLADTLVIGTALTAATKEGDLLTVLVK